VNQIGHRVTLVAAAAVALVLFRLTERRRFTTAAVAFLGGAPVVGWGIASLIGRSRPQGTGLSFPSGQVFGRLVVCGLIAIIVSRRTRLTYRRAVLFGLTAAVVLAGGIAPVRLTAHWPSDVAGAAPHGMAYVSLGVPTLGLDALAVRYSGEG
jgi:membrane-associated phospholipid phosphatase